MMEKKDLQSFFHRFIEVSAHKPTEASLFTEFHFMEQSIRKSFKQLNKTGKDVMAPIGFKALWDGIQQQEQVQLYFRWIAMLQQALTPHQIKEPLVKEGFFLIRKTKLSNWKIYPTKLASTKLTIIGSKVTRVLELHLFQIRKSRNKECFAWVLQNISESRDFSQSIHCGVKNVRDYEEWFTYIAKNIEIARVSYFKSVLSSTPQTPKLSPRESTDHAAKKRNSIDSPVKDKDAIDPIKMAPSGDTTSVQTKSDSLKDVNIQSKNEKQLPTVQTKATSVSSANVSETVELNVKAPSENELHPDLLTRMLPHRSIENITEVDQEHVLISFENNYRIYEKDIYLKMLYTVPFSKSLVFAVLNEDCGQWDSQLDTWSIKSKISSDNSAMIYQKDKSQGILYRERDFLFLRHCFYRSANGRQMTYMLDKSIDCINYPPFMTVTRGERELVWCLVSNSENETLLVLEGFIKGGGYMNASNDKQMTLRYMQCLCRLEPYIKQRMFSGPPMQCSLFKERWEVSVGVPPVEFPLIEENKHYDCNEKQESDFTEFIVHTSEQIEKLPQSEVKIVDQLAFQSEEEQTIKFRPDRTLEIGIKHLTCHYQLAPRTKPARPFLAPVLRGHHLWKGEWDISELGGLRYVDEDKMNEQKKVLTFIIKRIGRNIFSGKGILNISLPVDIFCRESNIERLAMSFGYAPSLLEPAALLTNPADQMKYVAACGISSSLIYLTMQKPFNPILGQTFQCWLDGCPVYFEQISHHPPIAAYMFYGRGFKITAYYWCLEAGLMLQLQYNPSSKRSRFFSSNSGAQSSPQEKMLDYFQGTLRQYSPKVLQEHLYPEGNQLVIPKALPTSGCTGQLYKVSGRWTKSLVINQTEFYNFNNERYHLITHEEYPLPSHSNMREDVIYRRMRDFVLSQEFKEVLEVHQRNDRKLREENKKTKK